MGSIKQPKYDNDLVNLGYLKQVINETKDNINNNNDATYSKSFNSPPNPPYYVGWTYIQNNKIYRCIKDRLVGSFSLTDWVVIYDEKQNSLIAENFLFLSEVDIKDQSDGKIETFYQDDDPSSDWNTSILKAEHEGDYWRTLKDGIYISYVYTKMATNPVTYDWLEINVPITIFDTINEHKNIFTEIPDSYTKNDFIRITNNEMIDQFELELEIGDYLYATQTNSYFNASDWLKKDDELSLKSLESYYYTTDQINKIVEVINSNIETDIKKSDDSIRAFVKQTYTEKTTTEELTKKVNANGDTIEEIKGVNTTEVPTMNLSELSILLDEISQTVSKNLTLINTLINTDTIELTEAAEGNIIELSIKGAMSLIFPSKKIFPSSNLYGKNSNLIVEHEDGTQEKIRLPVKRLRVLGDVSDEFIINSNETKLIKRIGVDENNEEYLLSEEQIVYYDNISIPLKSGKNIIYLSSFKNSGLVFSITYALKNEFTDTFATKIEMASSILASANGIRLETKQEIENATAIDVLVSRINMSPEEIKLLAKKIIFEGLVTANNNFEILLDGSMNAVNGNFKGHIEADSGSFKGNIYLDNGGKVIGGDGIITNLQFQCNFGETDIGWYSEDDANFKKHGLQIKYDIPSNFIISDAYVVLTHTPCKNTYKYWDGSAEQTIVYSAYARNIKLYKADSVSSIIYERFGYNGDPDYSSLSKSNVSEAFGSNGYTGSSTNATTVRSGSFASSLSPGESGLLLIDTADNSVSSYADALQKTARASATLIVIGYMSYQ